MLLVVIIGFGKGGLLLVILMRLREVGCLFCCCEGLEGIVFWLFCAGKIVKQVEMMGEID